MRFNPSLAAGFALFAIHATAAPVSAQIAWVGNGRQIMPIEPSPTSDVAYDPQLNVYLVVSAGTDYQPWLWGMFIDGAGHGLTGKFEIAFDDYSRAIQSPRVEYSPDVNGGAGGFLVAWASSGWHGWADAMGVRVVAYATYPGRQTTVYKRTREYLVSQPQIAYSRTSRRFLAAWSVTHWPSPPEICAQAIGLDAEPLDSAVRVASGLAGDLAWNEATNEFGLAYRTATGESTARFARLSVGGQLLRDELVGASAVPSTAVKSEPSVAVNSALGNYVMVWMLKDDALATREFFSAEIDSAGQVIASGSLGARDMEYASVSFNSVSRTFVLLAFCDQAQANACALELNEHGEAIAAPVQVTNTGEAWSSGRGGPRAAPASDAGWMVVFPAEEWAWVQTITTGTRDGGPAGAPLTDLCAGSDPFAAMGGGVCVYGGWVPRDHPAALRGRPSAPPAPSPVPGGCTIPDPFAAMGGGVCVNGGWVPRDHPLANPAPAPPPTPVPGGCTIPDPFVAMGGGVCVNGGWVPKNHPLANGGGGSR